MELRPLAAQDAQSLDANSQMLADRSLAWPGSLISPWSGLSETQSKVP
jgi:hypothetical protein